MKYFAMFTMCLNTTAMIVCSAAFFVALSNNNFAGAFSQGLFVALNAACVKFNYDIITKD